MATTGVAVAAGTCTCGQPAGFGGCNRRYPGDVCLHVRPRNPSRTLQLARPLPVGIAIRRTGSPHRGASIECSRSFDVLVARDTRRWLGHLRVGNDRLPGIIVQNTGRNRRPTTIGMAHQHSVRCAHRLRRLLRTGDRRNPRLRITQRQTTQRSPARSPCIQLDRFRCRGVDSGHIQSQGDVDGCRSCLRPDELQPVRE